MMIRRRELTAVMAALVPLHALAQTEPPRGSADRSGILDAIRPKIEAEMRGPVEFVVGSIRMMDGWAFATVDPQRPGGAPISISETAYAEDEGFMDGLTVFALVRKKGDRWYLVDSVTGPTDVAFLHWPRFYGAPFQVFGFDRLP